MVMCMFYLTLTFRSLYKRCFQIWARASWGWPNEMPAPVVVRMWDGLGAEPYTFAIYTKSNCKVIYFIFYLLVQRFVPLACRAIRFVVDCCYY